MQDRPLISTNLKCVLTENLPFFFVFPALNELSTLVFCMLLNQAVSESMERSFHSNILKVNF